MVKETVKQRLLTARTQIQDGNYEDALKICKEICSDHPDNFFAHLLAGKCCFQLNQLDDCRKYYNQARELDESQLTVWQGLVQLYEVQKDNQRLIETYPCLLKLLGDPEKSRCIRRSFAASLVSVGKKSEGLREYITVIDCSPSEEFRNSVRAELVNIISTADEMSDLDVEQIICVWKALLESYSGEEPDDDFADLKLGLAEYLHRIGRKAESTALVIPLYDSQPETAVTVRNRCVDLLETLLLEEYCLSGWLQEDHSELLIDLSEEEGSKMVPHTAVKLLAALIVDQDLPAALSLVNESDKRCSANPMFLTVAGEVYLKTHQYSKAVAQLDKAVSTISKDVSSADFIHAILLLIEALICANALETALDMCSKLPCVKKHHPTLIDRSVVLHGLILCKLNRTDEAKKALQCEDILCSADAMSKLNGIIEYHRHNYADAIQLLQKAIQAGLEEDPQCQFWAGQAHAKLDDTENSLASYLRAVQLDPYMHEAFAAMGRLYRRQRGDGNSVRKAVKCLERATSLSPGCFEYVTALCDTVDLMSTAEFAPVKISTLEAYCSSANVFSEEFRTAATRLALAYLSEKNYDNAISMFQRVSRVWSDSVDTWNLLGTSYLARGSYESALKTFQHVLVELEGKGSTEQLIQARYHVALLQSLQKQTVDATATLREILRDNSGYVPAIALFCETLLGEARRELTEGLVYRATLSVQEIVTLLAGVEDSTLMAYKGMLKTLADSLVLVANLATNLRNVVEMEVLVKKLHVLPALPEGVNAYSPHASLCLRLYQYLAGCVDSAPAWADFSSALLQLCPDSASVILQCLNHAHSLDASDVHVCTLLGDACSQSGCRSNAQEWYCRALQLQPLNASAWNNLGLLYLEHSPSHASHCLAKALAIEPALGEPWIAKALLLAKDSEHADGAVGLFYHGCTLSTSQLSRLNYALSVLRAFQTRADAAITRVGGFLAVPFARDCMQKYVVSDPTCKVGHYVLAGLYELDGMPALAVRHLQRCRELCDAGGATNELVVNTLETMLCRLSGKQKTYTSLEGAASATAALALARTGSCDDASRVFMQSWSCDDSDATIASAVCRCLAGEESADVEKSLPTDILPLVTILRLLRPGTPVDLRPHLQPLHADYPYLDLVLNLVSRSPQSLDRATATWLFHQFPDNPTCAAIFNSAIGRRLLTSELSSLNLDVLSDADVQKVAQIQLHLHPDQSDLFEFVRRSVEL